MERNGHIFVSSLVLLLLLHCSVAMAAIAPNVTTDQLALLALKDHITHDPTNILSNWSTDTPVCTWYAVTCGTRHHRVTALDLAYTDLVGTIPPEIGNLSFLSILNFTNNSFQGSLPIELTKLYRVKLISVRFNNLSGEIPTWFHFLPNLERLYLGYNSFTGTIPPSIFNISKLERLDLGDNNLAGVLPSNIFSLPYLVYLDVSDNLISGSVPTYVVDNSSLRGIDLSNNEISGELHEIMFFQLPNLQEFYINRNTLSGRIPPSLFNNCKNLQYLSLSFNSFSGNIPVEIGNATLLTWVFLGFNNLQGTMPDEIGKLKNLEIVGIQSANLNGSIPPSLFNISTIEEIALTENHLSGSLPSTLGFTLPNLQRLILPYNDLSGPFPTSISNASKLTELDLIYNQISGYIPSTLGNLINLEWLNLAGNNLTLESPEVFTSLANCKNLKRLTFQDNPLNSILPSSIGNLSVSLDSFAVGNCNLRGSIPANIGKLSGLTVLSLAINEMTGTIPTTLRNLQNLQRLYLDHNQLQGSLPDELCQLRSLGNLDLSGNKFSGPIPTCLANLTSLREMSLSSNRLNLTIPNSLWGLADIIYLDLSSNNLSGHLPEEIENLKVLTQLYLSDNQFSGNIPSGIGSLQDLVNLSLARNSFEGPIPDTIGNMVNLEVLDLSENNLTGVIPKSLEELGHLKHFNVSFNKLHGEIPSGGSFTNLSAQSFMGNEALCSSQSNNLQIPPCKNETSNKRDTSDLVLKYVLPAAIAAIILLVALVCLFLKYRRRNNRAPASEEEETLQVGKWRRISYYEISRATNGFNKDNLLGEGSYGKVYKGTMSDGKIVAIKVFNLELEGGFKSFDAECEVLCNIRHRNLVKIISSCSNNEFKALVLSYMSNGSLEKWLYSDGCNLKMLQRLDIMIDVATAIEYLHDGYSTPIVHCDLKPSNVLLDHDMVAHVADFGLAKLLGGGDSVTQTMTLATIGYMAPEYGLEGMVSRRGDVYSYGMLLMETFTKSKPTDEMFLGELTLKKWVKQSFPHAVAEILDTGLLAEEGALLAAKEDCLSSVIRLALNCSADLSEERPSIKEVLVGLNKIRGKLVNSSETSIE